MTLILALACDQEPMAESWQIDRLRVLAVAAEPAEPAPGDLVNFSALIVAPDDDVAGSAWFTCSAEASSDFGCDVDTSLFTESSADDLDFEALQAAGLIGFLPALPPTWVVPADYLDALAEEDRVEGTFAMTFIAAFPNVEEGGELAEDDVEIAYKRVPVSLASTPNQNPVLRILSVDGVEIAPGAEVSLDPGQAYTLGVILEDDSVESYEYLTSEGELETRTEEPYFTWYAESGSFSQTDTLWPTTEVVYFAPEEPESDRARVWVVVRDRRGGMAWGELALRLAR